MPDQEFGVDGDDDDGGDDDFDVKNKAQVAMESEQNLGYGCVAFGANTTGPKWLRQSLISLSSSCMLGLYL